MEVKEYAARQLKNGRLMVGNGDASVSAVNPKGKVLWTVGLTPGIEFSQDFVQYLKGKTRLRLEGDVTLLKNFEVVEPLKVFGQRHKGAQKTGANQDFVPTAATAAQIEAKKLLDQVRGERRKIERIREEERKAKRDEEIRIEAEQREAAEEAAREEAEEAARQAALEAEKTKVVE